MKATLVDGPARAEEMRAKAVSVSRLLQQDVEVYLSLSNRPVYFRAFVPANHGMDGVISVRASITVRDVRNQRDETSVATDQLVPWDADIETFRKAAFNALKLTMIHELRESWKYKGEREFDPHVHREDIRRCLVCGLNYDANDCAVHCFDKEE